MIPSITLRSAVTADAPAITDLLAQLGYSHAVADVAERLTTLAQTGADPALVASADDGRIVGVIALHIARMLFYPLPVARITTLVVDEVARGRGIGRVLVEAASALAGEQGCGLVELTTALRREDAQAFYRTLGFEGTSIRMARTLGQAAPNIPYQDGADPIRPLLI